MMHHLLKTVLGAAILIAAYGATFGLPGGGGEMDAEDIRAALAAPGPRRPGGPRGPAGAASLQLEAIVATPYSETLTAIGTSRARRSVTLTADIAGQVAEADLVANRSVAEGDVLLRLSSDLEQIEVTIAETELENARRTLERYRTLNGSNSGAVAEMTVREAETAVILAEAALAKARQALDQLTIRAPISGRLGLSDLRTGDKLSGGAEIVTIDDTSSIIVSFELPERAIELLEVGREIHATTPALAGRSFVATITAFDSRIDETTRTITVQAEIDNTDGRLWPGMSFSVQISNESGPLPQIPSSALSWTKEGARVWAVRDGIATAVPVTVRMRQGDVVWIEGELGDSDHIVADGSARLRDGAAVASTPIPASDESTSGAGLPTDASRSRIGATDTARPQPGKSGPKDRAGGAG